MPKKRKSSKILETFNFASIAKTVIRESDESEQNRITDIKDAIVRIKDKVSRMMAVADTMDSVKVSELLVKVNDLEDMLHSIVNKSSDEKKHPLDIKQ